MRFKETQTFLLYIYISYLCAWKALCTALVAGIDKIPSKRLEDTLPSPVTGMDLNEPRLPTYLPISTSDISIYNGQRGSGGEVAALLFHTVPKWWGE